MSTPLTLMAALTWLATISPANAQGAEGRPFTSMDTREPNALLDTARARGEDWADLPVSIALKLFGPPGHTEGRSRYSIDQSQSQPDQATVTVTREGLMDDSIAGERRVLTFSRKNDQWVLNDLRLGVRCQPGRGHANWSGQSCR